MPTFTLPDLSATNFVDGAQINPGDECFPVLLVLDSNGKGVRFDGPSIKVTAATTSYSAQGERGSAITGPDSGGSAESGGAA